jgi:hypothetical protein
MRRDQTRLWATLGAITLALVVYSQTKAFGWDEGFHLLAARLILAGKRPYQDFLFAQTPLNAYWNALLMRVFGVGWRAPHVASALEMAGATALIADYVYRRAEAASRLALAITAAFLLGSNDVVVWYATLGQAYGMCLLLGALAFRFGVAAVDGAWWMAALAGLAAGAEASSSLLAAAIGPVLFVWLALQTRGSRRISQLAGFVLGAVAGLGPALWFLIRAPHTFIFDVVGYHVFYRHADWSDWFSHDIGILTGWVNSGFGLVLVALAVAGAIVGSGRTEIVLAAWLAAVSCVYLSTTHPTFSQYFIPAMPFAVVLASEALRELTNHYPRRWPLVLVGAITVAGLGKDLWEERTDMAWSDIEPVAKAVLQAKPDPKPLYADEHIYLLTGIMPISGLEWGSGHKIEIPLDQARPLHVLPQTELDKEIKRGDFGIFETCSEDEIDRLGLNSIYGQKKKIAECYVFSRQ